MKKAMFRLLAAAAVLYPAILPAAIEVYLELKAEGSLIRGTATAANYEDWIVVLGFMHEVVQPRDGGTGAVTEPCQHKAFTIVKEMDKATPLIFKALCEDQHCDFKLEFIKPSPTPIHYFTITLVDARITSVRPWMPVASGTEETKPMEEVSFVYRKIRWTYEPDGIEYEATVGAPER